jgi:hypothetical protein
MHKVRAIDDLDVDDGITMHQYLSLLHQLKSTMILRGIMACLCYPPYKKKSIKKKPAGVDRERDCSF